MTPFIKLDFRDVGKVPRKCTRFRDKLSRGIEPKPAANISALTIGFSVGSAEITPESQKTLDSLGRALSDDTLKPCCFEIQGYTDSSGGAAYNKKLSQRRADSVIAYLAGHAGVEKERMLGRGFGKEKPIASNDTAEGRTRNRRVQVVNVGYGEKPK